MLFRRRRDYDTEAQFLEDICTKGDGTFIPDDDKKAVSCVFSDDGLAVTYFASKDSYVITVNTDSYSVTVASKDRPELTVTRDGVSFSVEDVIKASGYPSSEE